MIHFLDGPAEGVRLNLGRTPLLLRVTRSMCTGEFDALDQLEDEAKDTEEIFAYRIVSVPRSTHICSRGKGGGCRTEIYAQYRVLLEQPGEEFLRTTAAWGAWCDAHEQEIRAALLTGIGRVAAVET